MSKPDVAAFFDARTGSVQYIVSDPATKRCAIVDPVLDYDEKSGTTATRNQFVIQQDNDGVADFTSFEIAHPFDTALYWEGVTFNDMEWATVPCFVQYLNCAFECAYSTGSQVICRNGAYMQIVGTIKLGGRLVSGGTFFQVAGTSRSGGGLSFYPFNNAVTVDATNLPADAYLFGQPATPRLRFRTLAAYRDNSRASRTSSRTPGLFRSERASQRFALRPA